MLTRHPVPRMRSAPYATTRNRMTASVPRCLEGEQHMAIEALIIWLVIGAAAGWLAGQIMKGGGFGLVGDIVLGIVGAAVGGWLLPRLGILIFGGILGEILNAAIGACLVLFVLRLVKR
jgi:uncharacterized membrane protein YeaQ/YmgE (transglycosylase-associated protein family)